MLVKRFAWAHVFAELYLSVQPTRRKRNKNFLFTLNYRLKIGECQYIVSVAKVTRRVRLHNVRVSVKREIHITSNKSSKHLPLTAVPILVLCWLGGTVLHRTRLSSNDLKATFYSIYIRIDIIKTSALYRIRSSMVLSLSTAGDFWGAKGAPILFSDLGFCMASCSYIYICHKMASLGYLKFTKLLLALSSFAQLFDQMRSI